MPFIARTSEHVKETIRLGLVAATPYGPYTYEVEPDHVILWKFEQQAGRDQLLKDIANGKFRKKKELDL